MAKTNFKPEDFGWIYHKEEETYYYIRKKKVVGFMYHHNYSQGLPYEWAIYRVIHKVDGSTADDPLFAGAIPTKAFGKQLLENLPLK